MMDDNEDGFLPIKFISIDKTDDPESFGGGAIIFEESTGKIYANLGDESKNKS